MGNSLEGPVRAKKYETQQKSLEPSSFELRWSCAPGQKNHHKKCFKARTVGLPSCFHNLLTDVTKKLLWHRQGTFLLPGLWLTGWEVDKQKSTSLKINVEHNHGGLVQIMFLSIHGWFVGSSRLSSRVYSMRLVYLVIQFVTYFGMVKSCDPFKGLSEVTSN